MTILKNYEREYVENVFRLVENEVKISFFTQTPENQAGRETHEILEEISSISDNIILTVYDFEKEKSKVEEYQIDKIPAIVVEGVKDFGIRFFGVPSGYLVSSLIEDVIQISKNESELTDETKQKLEEVVNPLSLEVFVKPTSPYSPSLVNIAHRMALENENISAHLVNVSDYPHLAMRFNIEDVPHTVVNGKESVEGALNEKDFTDKILEVYRG
ncbi:MAG: thioredoxin family protein [Calditrichia bacterium]